MRGGRDPQATILAFVDVEERISSSDYQDPWQTRHWNASRLSTTACTLRWAGRQCLRSDC